MIVILTEQCAALDACYAYKTPLRFAEDGVLYEILFIMANAVFFTIILFVFESNYLTRLLRKGTNHVLQSVLRRRSSLPRSTEYEVSGEDDDVLKERGRVNDILIRNNFLEEEAFLINNLQKSYDKFTPVKKLTLGVHHQECFGLLGVNGAGKTTTFRMLTGDLEPTDGDAFVRHFSLIDNLSSYQTNIGYCPQFDAHLHKLTGVETLYLFGRLRGIREDFLRSEVNQIIDMVDLKKHAEKLTETYSGGNRRKLSLGMALIGAPPLLLLDEPTCGVDPTARRKIWSALASVRHRYGSSIILTSHSMEECECLCSRIAIMVSGQFKCLGSIQHLRAKYGQGYTLTIKFRRERAEDVHYVAAVKTYVKKQVPSAALKDFHEMVLNYHVSDITVSWSFLFTIMERAKQRYNLEDYALSDTTLEQIFISFARQQGQLQMSGTQRAPKLKVV